VFFINFLFEIGGRRGKPVNLQGAKNIYGDKKHNLNYLLVYCIFDGLKIYGMTVIADD